MSSVLHRLVLPEGSCATCISIVNPFCGQVKAWHHSLIGTVQRRHLSLTLASLPTSLTQPLKPPSLPHLCLQWPTSAISALSLRTKGHGSFTWNCLTAFEISVCSKVYRISVTINAKLILSLTKQNYMEYTPYIQSVIYINSAQLQYWHISDTVTFFTSVYQFVCQEDIKTNRYNKASKQLK